jgi:hypothetical protein
VLAGWTLAAKAEVEAWTQEHVVAAYDAARMGRTLSEWPKLPSWVRELMAIYVENAEQAPCHLFGGTEVISQLLQHPPLPTLRAVVETYGEKLGGAAAGTTKAQDLEALKRTILEHHAPGTEGLLDLPRTTLDEKLEHDLVALVTTMVPRLDAIRPVRTEGRPPERVWREFYRGVASWFEARGQGSPKPADLADLAMWCGLETAERKIVVKRWEDRLRPKLDQNVTP